MVTVAFDPVFFRLGPLELGWHGLFTALAIGAGVWWGLRGAGRIGITAARLDAVLAWAVIGGFVGARLFHVADHLSYYLAHPLEIFAAWEGGIAVWGGFIGAVAAGLIAARGRQLPIRRLLDVAAPAMLIGQAVGRLGCLANGDAWGRPTGADWGIVYAHPNDRLPRELLGVATHPYPLYEIGAVLVLLGLLALLRPRLRRAGDLFAVAAIGYAAIRFALTAFREEALVLDGLQEAQVIALVVALAGAVTLATGRRRPRRSVAAAVAASDASPGGSRAR